MEEFCSLTSIHGVEFFSSPKDKFIRRCGFFVFFIAFCGLGFYMHEIYVKWQIDPIIGEEESLIPLRDVPFPAITICNPIFARDQKPNLYEVLKSDPQKLKLLIDEQNHLAANVQSCAPYSSEKLLKFCPERNRSLIVETLREKFRSIDDSFAICSFQFRITSCKFLLNYVLTDFGFCFSYNLLDFNHLFNTDTIADDFKSYQRTNKIAKDYSEAHTLHNYTEVVDEDHGVLQWTLEEGYKNNSDNVQPTRAAKLNAIIFFLMLNFSDISPLNLCPETRKAFQIFLHLPNEILSPFHKPLDIRMEKIYVFTLSASSYTTDENLKTYSPSTRGCYFEGEKKLKFFKFYTKSNCEFECLANETLKACGCVKFSMPRNDSTPICDLDQVKCYENVKRNWSKLSTSCECFQSCTRIEYKYVNSRVKFVASAASGFVANKSATFSRCGFNFFEFTAKSNKIISYCTSYNVFAEFGGHLGVFFGCSILSVFEIFYFLLIILVKVKTKLEEKIQSKCSKIASECTVHGFQFIFDSSLRKILRILWFLAFLLSLTCCLYNAKESFIKLLIEPEIETMDSLRPTREFPFPSITICSQVFAKNGLANYQQSMKTLRSAGTLNISGNELNYLTSNLHRFAPNIIRDFEDASKNIFRPPFDIISLFNQSSETIDELFHSCKLRGLSVNCSKLFKRVLVDTGFCFAFNQLNFLQLFTDKISPDFFTYSKEEFQKSIWNFDRGYESDDEDIFPVRAAKQNELIINLKTSHQDASNFFNDKVYRAYIEGNRIQQLFFFKRITVLKLFLQISQFHDEFRRFFPRNRGCYFTDERKLKFFKVYSKENCELECLANFTLNFKV